MDELHWQWTNSTGFSREPAVASSRSNQTRITLKELSHGLRERAPYHVILEASIQKNTVPASCVIDKAYAMFVYLPYDSH